MQEYEAVTQPSENDTEYRVHAFDDGSQVITELSVHGQDEIFIELIDSETDEPRGAGSAVLMTLTTLADKYGVKLSLGAVASGGLSQNELIQWYRRYGFKRIRGSHALSDTMVREPNR